MKYPMLILLVTTSLGAQSFIQNIESVNQEIGQSAVDHYLKNPGPQGLPGSFLVSLTPTDPSGICEKPQELNQTHYEVILIGNERIENGGLLSRSVLQRQISTL